MDFYDVINSRRTIRDFTDQSVDIDIVKKVLSAGLKAPSNDHMQNWEFVIITEKEVIAPIIKKIPKKASDKRVEFIIKSWRLQDENQKKMYYDAIPKQYEMLYGSSCLILPFFKQKSPLLNPTELSSLNAFASIWCCIENILLAATAEDLVCAFRIPHDKETEHIAEILNHPKEYFMPCYIALGYPSPNAVINQQNECKIEERIHFNCW